MATSKIEIIKRAASMTGNGGLVSLDDNEEVARIAEEHYEAIVSEMLCAHTWPWARRSAALMALDDTPERPWSRAWAKPTLLLALSYVCDEGGFRVDAEERDTESSAAIVTMGCGDTKLFAVGTYRVAEDRWSADFAAAVQKRMEAVFRKGIAEQQTEGNRDDQAAEMKTQRARTRTMRSSTSPDASEWDLTRARSRSTAWFVGR